MTARHLLPPLLIFLALAACSTSHPLSPPADTSIHVTATLIDPVNVQLQWKDPDPNVAGHIVEYANSPTDDFVTLAFLPPDQTTFKHPDLIPHTSFYYRIRAYNGPASAPVEVSLPKTLSDQEYTTRSKAAEDYSWGQPKSIPPATPAQQAPTGTPTDFHATPMPITVSGFHFTWTNHASDADGILLEIKLPQSADFEVAALVAPTINSFGWGLEPPTRNAAVRIRPIRYSTPSNIPSVTTGAAPPHP